MDSKSMLHWSMAVAVDILSPLGKTLVIVPTRLESFEESVPFHQPCTHPCSSIWKLSLLPPFTVVDTEEHWMILTTDP
jgi:hypothetical protein